MFQPDELAKTDKHHFKTLSTPKLDQAARNFMEQVTNPGDSS